MTIPQSVYQPSTTAGLEAVVPPRSAPASRRWRRTKPLPGREQTWTRSPSSSPNRCTMDRPGPRPNSRTHQVVDLMILLEDHLASASGMPILSHTSCSTHLRADGSPVAPCPAWCISLRWRASCDHLLEQTWMLGSRGCKGRPARQVAWPEHDRRTHPATVQADH